VVIGLVHALPIYEGMFAVAKRTKSWKKARRCEGMRLAKEFKNLPHLDGDGREVDPWENLQKVIDPDTGQEVELPLWQRCLNAANEWLGVSQGTEHSGLRSETWKNESPVGFDITSLSPAVYMQPC